jgi:hypothetical protein
MPQSAQPRLRITDPRFAYVPAFRTDVRETFARARARMPVPGITVLEVVAPPPDLASEDAGGAPR